MNNVTQIKAEKAAVAFDPDFRPLRGKFIGLSGGADLYAESVRELVEEGCEFLMTYLEMCREIRS